VSRPRWLPTTTEVAREAVVVLAGAVLAAAVIGAFPMLRNWIKRQWGDSPR
jgi:hypothetical protein